MAAFDSPNDRDIGGSNTGPAIIIGRVKDIVLGEYKKGTNNVKDEKFKCHDDVGKISFEFLYSPNMIPLGAASREAYPMFSAIKQFPLIGEIVMITRGPSPDLNDDFNDQHLYYFLPYMVWNTVNHNSFPNLEEYSAFIKNYKQSPEYQGSANPQLAEVPKGYYFTERDNIRPLVPFEGDTIVEARYGQSIRFGSTTPDMKKFNHWSDIGNFGDPITIIRNGQGIPSNVADKFARTVEDINSDASSIYLTNGQKISIDSISSYPLDSFPGAKVSIEQQDVISSYKPLMTNEINSAAIQDKKTFNL
jgi:hypothetical protein